MKKIIFSLSALAALLLAASCQQENLEPVQQGNTVTYTVQVPQDIATKADGEGFTLHYEVYRKDDLSNLDAVPFYEGKQVFENGSADVQLEFVKDQEFTVLFWAQKTETDAFKVQAYDITDLREVSLETLVANDLTAEVFAGNDHVRDCKSDKNGNVVLVRPVAQLNIATTADSFTLGTEGSNTATVTPNKSKVVVNGLYDTYNVATGTAGTKASRTYAEAAVPGSDFKGTYKLMATNYLGFIPQAGDNVEVKFTIYTDGDGNIEHTVSNVPVKANYQTNIVGNLISATADYQVTLEDWADAGKDMEVLADGIVENINGDYEISTAVGFAYAINNLFADGGTFYIHPGTYNFTGLVVVPQPTKPGAILNVKANEVPVVTRSTDFEIIGLDIDYLVSKVVATSSASFSGFVLPEGTKLVGTNEGTVGVSNCTNEEQETGADLIDDNTNGKFVNTVSMASVAEITTAMEQGLKLIELTADMSLTEIFTISSPVTIDGCGHKLTSSAGRAINVDGVDGVTIKNLVIECTGERAINVINNATNVTIDNVTATAANYTVNVALSAPGAVVKIENCTLNGLNTVNVASPGAEVSVDNSTINCNDNNTTVGESYAALCLNKAAVGAEIIATNTVVNVTDGSDSSKGRNGAEDGTVTINGSTEGVTITVVAITYPGTDNYYGFETLPSAIEFAKETDVISLIRNISVEETIVVEEGKTVVLDLNRKTITGTMPKSVGHVLKNEGTLTLKNGTISSTGANGGSAIYNAGTLVVENVFINGAPQEGSGWPSYAVNNYGPATFTETTITSNHGAVASYADVTINNCNITMNGFGGSSHVFYFGDGADVVVNGGVYTHNGNIDGSLGYIMTGATITINDGTFSASNGGYGLAAYKGSITVNGGYFTNKFEAWGGPISVTGGTFTAKANPMNYLAEGYKAVKTAAGYTVIPDSDSAVFADDDSAVEAALDNPNVNTIYLDAKEYTIEMYTNFDPKESLTIIGTEGTKVKFANAQVRLQLAQNFTIKNCEILHMATKTWGMLVFGGRDSGAVNCTVSNCSFKGVGTQGIYINENISGAVYNIKNCTFDGDFGSADGAVTIQNNHGVEFTVNVTGCKFNTDSNEICYLYNDPAFTLNTDSTVAPVCLNR